jgi:hypothetical protein
MITDYMTESLIGTFASPPVWAYLDPGAGSMVLQVLLAGILSSVFFVKSWARQIRAGVLLKNKRV